MTRSIKTLALAALLTATTASTLFAKGNRTTLTQNDWNEIENQAMMESVLDLESIPAVAFYLLPEEWNAIEAEAETENSTEFESIPELDMSSVKQGNLNLDLQSGKHVNLVLDAPFSASDRVGIAVINQQGNLIHAESGLFGEVKDLSFGTAFTKNATYIVRVYSADKVYETNLQVLYM